MKAGTIVLALAVASPAAAQVFPYPVEVDRLENGLTVVTARIDSPGIAAHYLLVRAGSRNEVVPGRTGFAHFFEHMMFRGTERFPSAAYEGMLQSLGADNNAYTSENHTCYTVVLPAAALDTLMDVEADRFQNLDYDLEGFQTEAHTIWGEYLTAISDPLLKLEETLRALAFRVHSYGHTVIGWQDDIKDMPTGYDFSREYFRRHYVPDNAFLIVTGDIDRAVVLERARARYGAWEGRLDALPVPAEPEQTEPRAAHVEWPTPAPRWMLMAWKSPAFSVESVDSAALDVADELLFGETGELYKRLVIEEQKLLLLQSWGTMDRDPGLLTLQIQPTDDLAFDEVVAQVQAAVDALAAGQVDPERVAEVKRHVRYALPMGLETPADAADLLAYFIGITGDPRAVDAYARRVEEVTVEDVARAARSWLSANRRTVVTLAPAAGVAAAEGGAP